MCHLQYDDNLLVMIVGDMEDLRIIKLILYIFEGPLTSIRPLPRPGSSQTIQCLKLLTTQQDYSLLTTLEFPSQASIQKDKLGKSFCEDKI